MLHYIILIHEFQRSNWMSSKLGLEECIRVGKGGGWEVALFGHKVMFSLDLPPWLELGSQETKECGFTRVSSFLHTSAVKHPGHVSPHFLFFSFSHKLKVL